MSKPLTFFVGRWDPIGFPLKPDSVIQVAITVDKNWEESFEVIEKSAYDALKQERDECKAAFEIVIQQMVLALEGKVALAAQLASARAYPTVDAYEAACKALNAKTERIERLERAVTHAKEIIKSLDDGFPERWIEEIEQMERGE